MSGAHATSNTGSIDHRFRGDVFTEDEDWNNVFNVVIECKKYSQPIDLVQYAKFIIGKKTLLSKWVSQCINEATISPDNKKDFWLIFSWNHGKDLIITGKFIDEEWQISEPMLLMVFLTQILYYYEEN